MIEVLLTSDDRVRVVRGRGEVDAVSVPQFLPRVPALVKDVDGFVLDLASATFFDSSGMRLLDTCARACARAGVAYRVVAPQGTPARRVLEIVEMSREVVVEDLADAVAEVLG